MKVNNNYQERIRNKLKKQKSATHSSSSLLLSDNEIRAPTYEALSLQGNSSQNIKDGLTGFQRKMKDRLKGSKFRWLNEKLYTSTAQEAFDFFKQNPHDFELYHEGFRSQVSKWPMNPADLFIQYLINRPHPSLTVGDFGCGEGDLGLRVGGTHKVYSFDLVAKRPHITACNISKVPLKSNSLDVAIFCLSLMGTNFLSFLQEAHRVLKLNGLLKIAEVESRFKDGVEKFVEAVTGLGFSLIPDSNFSRYKMFYLFDFRKSTETAPRQSGNGQNKKVKLDHDIPLPKPKRSKKAVQSTSSRTQPMKEITQNGSGSKKGSEDNSAEPKKKTKKRKKNQKQLVTRDSNSAASSPLPSQILSKTTKPTENKSRKSSRSDTKNLKSKTQKKKRKKARKLEAKPEISSTLVLQPCKYKKR